MAKNKNLNSAARNKNDEFYTQFDDIQREMNCYYIHDENFLCGKTLLLPCDDPEYSNFTKFFALNYKIWLGNGMGRWISGFLVPNDYELYGTEARIDKCGNRVVATNQCLWLTNWEHRKRHEHLRRMRTLQPEN